jgi:hypothetical protein
MQPISHTTFVKLDVNRPEKQQRRCHIPSNCSWYDVLSPLDDALFMREMTPELMFPLFSEISESNVLTKKPKRTNAPKGTNKKKSAQREIS